MTRSEFQKLLTEKIVILDGATGTELVKRGMPQGVCPELWILENPSAMIEIQQAYQAAGSDIVFVPSFGANRLKLEEFGLADRLAEINRSLWQDYRAALLVTAWCSAIWRLPENSLRRWAIFRLKTW